MRGTLLRLGNCGVLPAGAPPAMLWPGRTRVPVTRSEATRSGPAEDRAQQAEGRSRRIGDGSGPATSVPNAGGALTNRMKAETFSV
jgi:hypothetical protein